MLISTDKLLNIEVISSVGGYVLQPTDWSWMNVPCGSSDGNAFAMAYKSLQTEKHLALVTCRHKIPDVLNALMNLKKIQADTKFQLMDQLSISYDTPQRKSGTRLSPLAEQAFLFSRNGYGPNYNATSWFAHEGHTNATTFWDCRPYNVEGDLKEPTKRTVMGTFCWEIAFLMIGLCAPGCYRSFTYEGNPNDISLLSFIKSFGYKVWVFTDDTKSAEEAMRRYESGRLQYD